MYRKTPALRVSALLSGFEAIGLDTRAILSAGRIELPSLDDPLRQIPCEVETSLWAEALKQRPDPALPTLVGLSMPSHAAGLYDHLAETGATFCEMMYICERYHNLVSRTGSLRVTCGSTGWMWAVDRSPEPIRVIAEQFSLALLYRRSRQMYPDFTLLEVHLSQPDSGDADRFADLWGAPVRLGKRYSGMQFPYETWFLSNPTSNPNLQATLRRIVDGLKSFDLDPGMSAGRRILFEAFDQGVFSAAEIAHMQGISLRSLQRQLEREHVTFKAILDAYRHEQAFMIIQTGEHDMGEVARRLGYGSETAFSRAFQRWTGLSPRTWVRRELLLSA